MEEYPVFEGNIFMGLGDYGGGTSVVFNNGAKGMVYYEGNYFRKPSAQYGGAWSFRAFNGADGSVVMRNNIIREPYAGDASYGYAQALNGAYLDVLLENNVLYADDSGNNYNVGYIFDNKANLQVDFIHDTNIHHDSRPDVPALLVINDDTLAETPAVVNMVNSIMRADYNGGIGIRTTGTVDLTVTNSNVNGIDGAYTDGGGNINTDPLFVQRWLHQYGPEPDYRLQSDSPCIDAGVNLASSTVDADGNPRPEAPGGVVDMGAYEYQVPILRYYADTDGDGYSSGIYQDVVEGGQVLGYYLPADLIAADGDCNDADASVYPGAPEICDGQVNACGGVLGAEETDQDGDGVIFCSDICPGGDDSLDADGDGVPDFCDQCPDDPLKIVPGACGCGEMETDSDGDGTPDCADACDDRVDSDGDGQSDCLDPCPADNPDDPDGDGVCASSDVCPGGDDSLDADGDGTPDFCDTCPDDPLKIVPGACGCGEAEDACIPPPNRAPVIVLPPELEAVEGEALEVDCLQASDPDGDALRFEWSADAGTLERSGERAPLYIPPYVGPDGGIDYLTVVVDDGREDGRVEARLVVKVRYKAPEPETEPPSSGGGGGGGGCFISALK